MAVPIWPRDSSCWTRRNKEQNSFLAFFLPRPRTHPSTSPHPRDMSELCVVLAVLLLLHTVSARETLLAALQQHARTPDCRRHAHLLLNQTTPQELRQWSEASTKLPEELLSGRIYNFGDHSECVLLNTSDVIGQHCLVHVTVELDDRAKDTPPAMLHLFMYQGDRLRLPRNKFLWGFCLPETCSHEDLKSALEHMEVVKNDSLKLQVNATKYSCQTSKENEKEKEAFLTSKDAVTFMFVTVILILLTLTSTIVESKKEDKVKVIENKESGEVEGIELEERGQFGKLRKLEENAEDCNVGVWRRVLECFALQNHWTKLSRDSSTQIESIHGLKALTMVGVIIGHTSWAWSGGPVDNPLWVEQQYDHALGSLAYNGHSVVQTFFVITGVLETLAILSIYDKVRFSFSILLSLYLNRVMRILPAYIFVLWFNSSIMYALGSGPLWRTEMSPVVQDCQTTWWANLLFLNNYLNPKAKCMYHSWYLAMDMQLFLLTPVLLYLAHRKPRLGRTCLVVLLTLVIGSAFTTTVLNKLEPVALITPEVNRGFNLLENKTFLTFYMTFYNNAGSYLFGLIIGQALHQVRNNQWTITKRGRQVLRLVTALAHPAQLAIVLSGQVFYLPSYVYNEYAAGFYAALHGVVFGAASGVIVLASALGEAGFIHRILSLKVWRVIGRLTFTVYLVHPTIIFITSRSMTAPANVSVFNSASYFNEIYSLSGIWGMVLYILVESPFANIQKLFLSRLCKIS